MGKYLDKIRQQERTPPVVTEEASTQQKALGRVSTVHPGDRITWTRADGTTQTGLVDFVHVELDGIAWAFVAIGESWAAVNMKFVKGSNA